MPLAALSWLVELQCLPPTNRLLKTPYSQKSTGMTASETRTPAHPNPNDLFKFIEEVDERHAPSARGMRARKLPKRKQRFDAEIARFHCHLQEFSAALIHLRVGGLRPSTAQSFAAALASAAVSAKCSSSLLE